MIIYTISLCGKIVSRFIGIPLFGHYEFFQSQNGRLGKWAECYCLRMNFMGIMKKTIDSLRGSTHPYPGNSNTFDCIIASASRDAAA